MKPTRPPRVLKSRCAPPGCGTLINACLSRTVPDQTRPISDFHRSRRHARGITRTHPRLRAIPPTRCVPRVSHARPAPSLVNAVQFSPHSSEKMTRLTVCPRLDSQARPPRSHAGTPPPWLSPSTMRCSAPPLPSRDPTTPRSGTSPSRPARPTSASKSSPRRARSSSSASASSTPS